MTIAFIRFDLLSWLPRKQTLLPLAFIVVVGVALPVPGMAVVASAVVASMMISAPFLADERGRLDILYGLLPISRNKVVVGRAAALLVYYVIAFGVAALTTFVVAIARGDTIPMELVGVALAVGFAFIGLAMALQLPVLFRVGYTRGRLVAYAPAFVVAGLIWLNQGTGLVKMEGQLLSTIGLVIAGVVIGAFGSALGVVIATRMYRNRELR
ncbi:ABC-2 transporter permease [Microbacterium sp. MAHUQ-60]|uniref:ABC-2 transporter permease n=1 Tax=unclassified Microbacterium TaxID=2609290 RepID=UPI00361A3AC1